MLIKQGWQAAQDDEDELPRNRIEAFVELIIITPFTILRRVANVIIGPARVRRFDRWIDHQGWNDN